MPPPEMRISLLLESVQQPTAMKTTQLRGGDAFWNRFLWRSVIFAGTFSGHLCLSAVVDFLFQELAMVRANPRWYIEASLQDGEDLGLIRCFHFCSRSVHTRRTRTFMRIEKGSSISSHLPGRIIIAAGFAAARKRCAFLRSERTGTCPSSAIPSASGLGLPPLKRYRTRTPAKLLQVRHLSQIAARRRAKTASGQRAASGHSSGRGAPAQARPRRCRLCASATLSLSRCGCVCRGQD